MFQRITSVQNPLVKHFVKLRQDRSYRYREKSVVVEGVKVVNEILMKHPIKALFALETSLVPVGIDQKNVYIVNEAILQKVSGTQTPEGLIVEIEMPVKTSLQDMTHLIALDGVNDPGNMGTLLRSALALGWEGVFILESSCDPYNDKAIRAARGATFRLPIATGNWNDLEKLIASNNLTPIAADIDGEPLPEFSIPQKVLLVLGNEARGISHEAQKLCQKVTIPMPGNMESLNVAVAGGILMYSLISKIYPTNFMRL